MKILFLEKNLRGIDKLGPLYIARMLVDGGHEVDLLQTDKEDYLSKLDDVDWVMFSLLTGEQGYVREIASKIKETHPSIKICAGGPHVTFDLSYPEREPNVDFFVRGAGELIINDIIDGKIKDRVVLGPFPDIDEIPTPYRDMMYKYPELGKAKMKRFISVRGCPGKCTYCFNMAFRNIYSDCAKLLYKRRNPQKMIDEILEVRDQFGLGYVYFNDDNFSIDPTWVKEFCTLYKDQVDLPFGTGMRPDTVTPDSLKVMADANMVLTNYALETQNPLYQKYLLGRGPVNEALQNIMWVTTDLGIKTRILNMIGLPIPNPLEEALETLKFNMRLHPTDSWAAIYQPEPFTRLYDICIEKGYYKPDENYWTSAHTFYETSVLNIKDKVKIERLQKWWFYLARHRIDQSFIEMLLDVPLTEDVENMLTTKKRKIARRELYLMED